jgi:Fe-S-cluster containining protein
MFNFYDSIDNAMAHEYTRQESQGHTISCRKGCGHCCNINVDVNEVESDLIIDWLEREGRTVNVDQLMLRKDLVNDDYYTTPHNACVFLDENNSCTVYEVRPAACRKHAAISPAELCNMQKYPKGTTMNPISLDAELIASGLMNIEAQHGNLASMLLYSHYKKQGGLIENDRDKDV